MANQDSISHIAVDLLARIRWEQENGCPGYEHQPEPLTDAGEALSGHGNAHPTLTTLNEDIGDCTRCDLHRGRNNLVFGEGSENARLAFVGEGPGRDEDLAGRPFVGAAGQLLDKIIVAMGLARKEVYICNVVKCRPPNNRVPGDEERRICGQFLKRQLSILGPDIVVALGGTAAQYLLGRDEPLGKLRGRFHKVDDLTIMPTYHPAYLLRNPSGKRPVWEDMQMVMATLGLPTNIERR